MTTPPPSLNTRPVEDSLLRAWQLLADASSDLEQRDYRAMLTRLKAAARFALDALRSVEPQPWGSSPVQQLAYVAVSTTFPEPVRAAARLLHDARPPSSDLIQLETPNTGPGAWLTGTRLLVEYCAAVASCVKPPQIDKPAAMNGAKS